MVLSSTLSLWFIGKSLEGAGGEEVLSEQNGGGIGPQHITFTGLWLHYQILCREEL